MHSAAICALGHIPREAIGIQGKRVFHVRAHPEDPRGVINFRASIGDRACAIVEVTTTRLTRRQKGQGLVAIISPYSPMLRLSLSRGLAAAPLRFLHRRAKSRTRGLFVLSTVEVCARKGGLSNFVNNVNFKSQGALKCCRKGVHCTNSDERRI